MLISHLGTAAFRAYTLCVLRFPAILAMALALVPCLALAQVQEGRCAYDCQDQGPGGDCQPACQFFTCCPSVQPLLLAHVSMPRPPEPICPAAWYAPEIRTSPDPREIFHIPISL